MKRVLILTCALLLPMLDVMGQTANAPATRPGNPSAWQRYTAKGEEFSVTLPTLPAMSTSFRQSSPFERRWRERLFGAYADGVVYSIFSLEVESPQKALQRLANELQSRLGWDASTEQELTLNGFPGKQYLSRHPLGGTVQLFATKKHVYQVQAFGAPPENDGVRQFFSSLNFEKKLDGVDVVDGSGTPYEPVAEPESADASEKLFIGKEVDHKAIVIMKPEPSYTEGARQNQTTGTVVMKVVFSSTGDIVNMRIISALPYGLTDKAIEAAKKIRFIPAKKDGKFVSMWMQLEYNFNLY